MDAKPATAVTIFPATPSRLLANRVEGEVHTVVDTRGAVIAGLVGGLIAGMIFLVGRIAFRRN